MSPDFEIRYLNAGKLVKGVITFHALSLSMPRLFPADVLYKIVRRTYTLPLRQKAQLEREISWFLPYLEDENTRKWVLEQPFAAKWAEWAGSQVRL